jgi:DUF1365 family protein
VTAGAGSAPPEATASALYVGQVRHRRFLPRGHAFRYRLQMVYLDLDELDAVFADRWLWSVERANWASFRRRDYLGDPSVPLAEAVRARVGEATGRRPEGPIRMLTQLRQLGHCFNPVSFYYCFAPDGEQVEHLVAEITNTPWHERHAYVLDRADAGIAANGTLRWQFDKSFHVSPFMAMDHRYDWRFSAPGETLAVHMENRRGAELWFDATLTMRRRPLSGFECAKALLRHPFMTGKVTAGIYWQALRLWLKRIPFHDHPRHRAGSAASDPSAGAKRRIDRS